MVQALTSSPAMQASSPLLLTLHSSMIAIPRPEACCPARSLLLPVHLSMA